MKKDMKAFLRAYQYMSYVCKTVAAIKYLFVIKLYLLRRNIMAKSEDKSGSKDSSKKDEKKAKSASKGSSKSKSASSKSSK